ncbi:MAG: hypothetical protein ABIL74_06765, partial [candidate division WOR-3 bacterium]
MRLIIRCSRPLQGAKAWDLKTFIRRLKPAPTILLITGRPPRVGIFYLCKAKALSHKNTNAKSLITLTNLAHEFYRSFIRYKNM